MLSPERTDNVFRLGDPRFIGIERGLTEIRAGRPVVIAGEGEAFLALPVDGIDDQRLCAFLASCAPAKPRLAITARRARMMGIDAPGPVTLGIEDLSAANLLSLASDVVDMPKAKGEPAPFAMQAMLDLAKIGERLPAVLFVDAAKTRAVFDPPLMSVSAAAVAEFRRMTL